jgi:hypothetical protein
MNKIVTGCALREKIASYAAQRGQVGKQIKELRETLHELQERLHFYSEDDEGEGPGGGMGREWEGEMEMPTMGAAEVGNVAIAQQTSVRGGIAGGGRKQHRVSFSKEELQAKKTKTAATRAPSSPLPSSTSPPAPTPTAATSLPIAILRVSLFPPSSSPLVTDPPPPSVTGDQSGHAEKEIRQWRWL